MNKKDLKIKDIEIASQIDVDGYHDVAQKFFREIMNMNYPEEVLITDESSMFDFFWMDTWKEELEKAISKVKDVFGLDLDIDDDLLLIDIFKMIENL